jgi:hypothetical protein
MILVKKTYATEIKVLEISTKYEVRTRSVRTRSVRIDHLSYLEAIRQVTSHASTYHQKQQSETTQLKAAN